MRHGTERTAVLNFLLLPWEKAKILPVFGGYRTRTVNLANCVP
jgi:hypothetical protein